MLLPATTDPAREEPHQVVVESEAQAGIVATNSRAGLVAAEQSVVDHQVGFAYHPTAGIEAAEPVSGSRPVAGSVALAEVELAQVDRGQAGGPNA